MAVLPSQGRNPLEALRWERVVLSESDFAVKEPMWAAPVLRSFVQSMSSRERHPLDDEFFILSHVRPEGDVVGRLGDLPIPAGVIGEDGHHYVFEGIATRRPGGRFDVRTLRRGEWIVRPGLVYRQID